MAFPMKRKWSGMIIFAAFALVWTSAALLLPRPAQGAERARVAFIDPGTPAEIFRIFVAQTSQAFKAVTERRDVVVGIWGMSRSFSALTCVVGAGSGAFG